MYTYSVNRNFRYFHVIVELLRSTLCIALTLALAPSYLNADALGRGSESPFYLPQVFFSNSTVSRSGNVEQQSATSGNDIASSKIVKQVNITYVPDEIVELVSGRPAVCMILVERQDEIFGDCSFFLNSYEEGATSLVRLIQSFDAELIICTEGQSGLFKPSQLNDC